MAKISNTILNSRIPRKSRHIRWNCESSSRICGWLRYHFVIVDDKDRKGKLMKIINQLAINDGLVEGSVREGKVEGSKFRYLLASYDSPTNSKMIDWTKISSKVRQDYELREREYSEGLENYVADYFS